LNSIQPAITLFTKIEVISDSVLEYLFDSISIALTKDLYQFDLEQIQQLVNTSKNKSITQGIQLLIDIKTKGQNTSSMNSDQFKQSIVEMYNTNPASVTRILELTKEINVREATCLTLFYGTLTFCVFRPSLVFWIRFQWI
jgi:hypothetical protein